MGNKGTTIAGYSEEEVSELSPEELEGLKELDEEMGSDSGEDETGDVESDDTTGAEEEGDKDATSDKDKDDDASDAKAEEDAAEEEDETGDDTTSDDEKADGDKDDASAEENDEAADAEEEPSPSASQAPKPTFVAPDDLDQQLKDLRSKKMDLAKKFDEGEILAADYTEQSDALADEEWQLRSQQVRAEVSDDILKSQWSNNISSFLEGHEQYKPGSPLYNALDAEVRRIQTEQSDNMFDPAILETAHKNIVDQITAMTGAKPADDPGKNDGGKTEDGGKKTTTQKGLADIPPNLKDLPATDANDDADGGEFAQLDKLMNTNYEQFERKLAGMPEAERDRYMQYSTGE